MNRLVKLIDDLAGSGRLDMPVVAQIGSSDYEPRNIEFYSFLDKKEFDRFISDAQIIITQGGVGSIMTALKCKKPVIVVPRLKKYGEHVDDHQRELALAFAKKDFVLVCDDRDNLEVLIKQCEDKVFSEYISRTNEITQIINSYLNSVFEN